MIVIAACLIGYLLVLAFVFALCRTAAEADRQQRRMRADENHDLYPRS